MRVGAYLNHNNCEFVVWAPFHKQVILHLSYPSQLNIPMQSDGQGYWKTVVPDLASGARYAYFLDGQGPYPDPASFYQPDGVHLSSGAVDHASFDWSDHAWRGVELSRMIIYELHAGTFSPEGTFQGVINKLGHLQEMGINAIELMPVSQFPGGRNWGYDGVHPYAVQNTYGGPQELKRLVDACHGQGIAVILDVVYNHLGLEGNYFNAFGPYFTEKYITPWGPAINFDGQDSYGVRNFFIENALYWLEHFHVDALRLDAIHGIFDASPCHILKEMKFALEARAVGKQRPCYLIAENGQNDPRVLKCKELGGYELDAQWQDDFHHSLRTCLGQERKGYYAEYCGFADLVKSFQQGYVRFWDGKQGKMLAGCPNFSRGNSPERQIIYSQNHDQVGNRCEGERLTQLVDFETLKLCAGACLLSPYTPLIFMGEEFGAESPFLYFVSHQDQDLIQAVREGRKKEFEDFGWGQDPPDPQSEKTFDKSKLSWKDVRQGKQHRLKAFYQKLISFRLGVLRRENERKVDWTVEHDLEARLIVLKQQLEGRSITIIYNFSENISEWQQFVPREGFSCVIDSADVAWEGPGSLAPRKVKGNERVLTQPRSFVVYQK